MFDVQNISASGSNGADLSALAVGKPQDTAPDVDEARSFRGDDQREQSRDEANGERANRSAEQSAPKSPRARLSYSLADKDTYVEILNPRTGDVIKRFPPSEAEDQLRTFTDGNSGVFVNQVA